MSVLGVLAAGGAIGAASADKENVDAQNAQIKQSNLLQEEGAIRDMYEQAKEKRMMAYASAAHAKEVGDIGAATDSILQAHGLTTDQRQVGRGVKLATPEQQTRARMLAGQNTGYISAEKAGDWQTKQDIADKDLQKAQLSDKRYAITETRDQMRALENQANQLRLQINTEQNNLLMTADKAGGQARIQQLQSQLDGVTQQHNKLLGLGALSTPQPEGGQVSATVIPWSSLPNK